MPDYRRNRVAGGCYFFTVNLLDRSSTVLVTQVDSLREAVRDVRRRAPFHIDAWVVLPDHMHCIWTLPPEEVDYSGRWRAVKKLFSKAMSPTEGRSPARRHRDERGIWQRRFWEHTIRDDADYASHMDYVHFNPVKHGLAEHAADWPFSSFRRAVAQGIYPADWGGGVVGSWDRGERG
jgi:putative transposase